MSPVLVFAAAGGVSWLLRITFINLLPARKLPDWVRRALEAGGPAAMAALLTNDLAHTGLSGGPVVPAVMGTLVAAVVTWRHNNLALTAVAGIGVFGLGSLLV